MKQTIAILAVALFITMLAVGYLFSVEQTPRQIGTPRSGPSIPSGTAASSGYRLPTSSPSVVPPTTPPPVSGKSTAPKPVAGRSGIRGTVLSGPTCPVERIPPDPRCADKPYEASLVAVDVTGVTVKQFSSKSDGTFEVSLLPGRYILRATRSGPVFPRIAPVEVTVTEGSFADVAIRVDTGIR